jgi:chromosomal replication initiation ATPase DnaA
MQNPKMQQLPLDLAYRAAMGRDDFLVGKANQAAVSWLDLWPNWPAPALVINGPAGSGKSHLAAVWRDMSGAEIIHPEALLSKQAEQIAATGRAIILDGIDPWLGDAQAERTLFHLYNLFREEQRTMLITMRMSPSETDFAIADIASRLRAAPLASIQPPDDDLLAAVLIKLFHDRQLSVSEDLIRYILPRMERSFAAAGTIVQAADKLALSQKRGVSIPLIRQVLADLQSS